MLGIDYWLSVLLVGVLMTIYVIFGGMRATSWVQITKAVLLLGGSAVLTFIVFSRFNFNISEMFHHVQTATPLGKDFLNPGNKYTDGLDMISFNMSLVLWSGGPSAFTRPLLYSKGRSYRKEIRRIFHMVYWGIFHHDDFPWFRRCIFRRF